MRSSTLLNSDSQDPKLVGVDLTVYKLMAEESSLMLLFKASAKNERLRSNMLYLTCTKKFA